MPSSNTTMRSQCPVGYEAVDLTDSVFCPVVEDVLSESDSSSLWLIKVPHDFDVSSLSGQNVILNGSQDLLSVNNNKNKDKRYEIQSKADGSAELSSFSVLLPSSQKKSLCAASSIHGQMSVIRSVSVPPPTLPDSSDSLTVQRQSHSEHIKKWKPFGYRKPRRKLKEKKTKEPTEQTKETADGGRKKNKKQKSANLEESPVVEREENEKSKRDSPKKKKKKDKERQEFDLSRVKTEPGLNKTKNDNHNSTSVRKRKGSDSEKFEDGGDENGLTPTKQRKKENKTKNVDTVKVKLEYDADDAGRSFVSEVGDGFDLARVKSEPRESPKKVKKHKKHIRDKQTASQESNS